MAAKKVLILAANPTASERLRLGDEIRDLMRMMLMKSRVDLQITPLLSCKYNEIADWIFDQRPEIVHFCGHGQGEAGLVFEGEDGAAKLVSTDTLATLFERVRNDAQCVVLNACYSEVQAEEIAKYIDYVVGMHQAVGDAAAIDFAVGFYRGVRDGADYRDALNLGRSEIQIGSLPAPYRDLEPVGRPAADRLPPELQPRLLTRQDPMVTRMRLPDPRVIYAGIALFACCLLSLLASYFATGSPAWMVEFGWFYRRRPENFDALYQTGWVLELAESVLCVFAFVAVLGVAFREAAAELLLRWRRPPDRPPAWFWGCRLLGIGLVVFTATILILHHGYWGPHDLSTPQASRKWLRDVLNDPAPIRAYYQDLPTEWSSPKYWRYYRLPFLLYLPYSVLNFLAVAIPMGAVTLYAAGLNLVQMMAMTGRLETSPDEETCEALERRFLDYRDDLTAILDRHSLVCVLICAGFCFEVFWGQFFYTQRAFFFISLAFLILLSGFTLSLSSVGFYLAGCRRVRHLLGRKDCTQILADFRRNEGYFLFLSRALQRSPWLLLNLILALVGVAGAVYFRLFPPSY